MHSDTATRIHISGAPGSGKSTIGRLLAERFERSVYIDADAVRESIIGGFAEPSVPVSEEFIAQTALQREIVISWAERMAAAGYVTIVDDAPIPSPAHFTEQYRSFWDHPTTRCVMLRPSADETRERISARGKPFDDFLVGVVDTALGWIDQLDLSRWDLIDSTGTSPAQTVDEIMVLIDGATPAP